ncbi:MAG TPA: GNAT family N-acetyltransferase [Nitrososphaerales archaeon]|nr:GNAT family N-acetyltransferase [Nitrososphaerales archaeon]
MEIRNCESKDLESVSEIENASFEEPYPLELFVRLLKNFHQGFRVAILENKIAGYCVISPLKWQRIVVISSLATHPEFRNQGVGSALLADAIRISRETSALRSFKKLILQVAADNTSAQSLYSKFGFEFRGTIRNYYGRGRDGIQMELDLLKKES